MSTISLNFLFSNHKQKSSVCPNFYRNGTRLRSADGEIGSLKIDLSQLFGAPTGVDQAVAERDAELVADGREAVGATIGLPKRQCGQPEKPRDALDDLMDGLDKLDF